jgi:hypothetical protein
VVNLAKLVQCEKFLSAKELVPEEVLVIERLSRLPEMSDRNLASGDAFYGSQYARLSANLPPKSERKLSAKI